MVQHPVIIIGAARSGTKLLRSLLASSDRFSTIAYDVNFIWRTGNERFPHDALPVTAATELICDRIRGRLTKLARRQRRDLPMLEKTVGNVLRLPFVVRVFPEAKFVSLIRDGWDVTESAARCWQERPRLEHLLPKLRAFPDAIFGRYGVGYAWNATRRLLRWSRHLPPWGPRYPQLESDRRRCELPELCARQWVACVTTYEQDRGCLPADRLLEIRYEDLVSVPERVIFELTDFLQLPDASGMQQYAASEITAANIGKHRCWPEPTLQRLAHLVEPVRRRWGYESLSGLSTDWNHCGSQGSSNYRRAG